MGPSIFVDGENASVPAPKIAPCGFNGAVDLHRRRGSAAPAADSPARRASMGPSIFIDGEGRKRSSWARLVGLQWGRRSSSTERGQRSRALVEGIRASMGPSIFIDGEVHEYAPGR